MSSTTAFIGRAACLLTWRQCPLACEICPARSLHSDARTAARRRGDFQRYLSGVVFFWVEPNGTVGPVGFFDCLGFFFSLLLRS